MSFNDIGRGVHQGRPAANANHRLRQPAPADHTVITLSSPPTLSQVSRLVFTISTSTATIRNHINASRRHAPPNLRTTVERLIEETTENIKHADKALKELPRGIEQQKLLKDFKVVVKEFQKEQQVAVRKVKEVVSRAREVQEHTEAEASEDDPLLSPNHLQQQQQQHTFAPSALDSEIIHNEAMIIEREEEVRRIEQGITEINQIFRDLGTIVGEQGNMLDNIEDNVHNIATSTENANDELRRASKSQRTNRNRMCHILLGLVAVVLILVLIVVPR